MPIPPYDAFILPLTRLDYIQSLFLYSRATSFPMISKYNAIVKFSLDCDADFLFIMNILESWEQNKYISSVAHSELIWKERKKNC